MFPGGRVTDGGAAQVNFVNNYYQPGPASQVKCALQGTCEDNLAGQQTYYCAGNTRPPYFSASSTQVVNSGQVGACHAQISFSPALTYKLFYDKGFFPSYVETHSADEARRRGISDAGASQPQIDDHDQRIRKETLSGTTTYTGSKSGIKGLIDNEKGAGGLVSRPSASREASWDANNDGIADWWGGSNGGVRGYTVLVSRSSLCLPQRCFMLTRLNLTGRLPELHGRSTPVHHALRFRDLQPRHSARLWVHEPYLHRDFYQESRHYLCVGQHVDLQGRREGMD